jgi:hypothetical protein
MTRKAFLTLHAFIALAIGLFVVSAPRILLINVKAALPSETAEVMARTAGVLIVAFGLLNLLVRGHADSPTLRTVLFVNLVLQLMILPIDPIAYASGVYATLGSFIPNTILHLLFAFGFLYYLLRMPAAIPTRPAPARTALPNQG